MNRKITWIIPLSVLGLVLVILGGSYYLRFSENHQTLTEQQRGDKEFLDFSSQKKKLSQVSEEVSLVAVGDISFSRAVGRIVDKKKDINYPFLKMQDYLKSSDLVFGNLETPITKGRDISDFEMIFRSNPGTEQSLKQAGFSILSLANNHTPNFGEQGLKDTFSYLENAGIKYVGAGQNILEANQPVFLEAKGIRFAFLAYNDVDVVPPSYEASSNRAGTAFMRKDKMVEAVKEAKQQADFVIVSMHSGIEYTPEPNDSQIDFAHTAINAGADLVIGHHPHVVQTMEEYKGKYIFYSLGNFVFDQPQSQETKEGLAIKVYFTKNEISGISLLPIVMKNFAQPEMVTGDEGNTILQRLKFPLAINDVYFWNNNNSTFEKTSKAVIRTKDLKRDDIVSKKETADLDNDSVPETYTLNNGQLSIVEISKVIWQSPANWWIDDFVLADSNNDGIIDLNLSVWKAGNFGSSKPFWVKENDTSIKNHFFIFDLVNGIIKPVWQSSNLTAPNCEFKIIDVDGDGKNDLIVVEGDYSQKPMCNGNYVATWKWNDWGFSNEWRSEKGNFSNIEIERNNGINYIMFDSLNL
jgi:poly-gamma-glutamate capsule biosynthesis protein CapA/YwtB (metallophosphatase superfamily)